ncbi:MAG: hypothetical protein AAB726_00590 [Patescibacteria group bacterium]
MKIGKTTSSFLFLLGLAIIGLGANYAAFVFIKRANLKISEQSNIAEISKGRVSGLFGREKNDVRAQIIKLHSRVLSEDGAVSFLESIETYAKDHEVELKIDSVTIDPPVDPANPGLTETLRLRLEGEGSWQNINELIFYLEHLPYKSSFESVALSKLESSWRIRAELTVLKAGPVLKVFNEL